MVLFKNYLFYWPLNIAVCSQKFLNGRIIWLMGLTNSSTDLRINLKTKNFLIIKEIFLDRENAYSSITPYLKFYFNRNKNQRLNDLKTKLKPNLLGLLIKYKKILTVHGGGYKFTLFDDQIMLELGYSHKIAFVWPIQMSGLKLSRRDNALQVKSYNASILTGFLAMLKKVQPLNVYSRKGLKYKNEMFKYKQVKRKKFV